MITYPDLISGKAYREVVEHRIVEVLRDSIIYVSDVIWSYSK